MSDDWQRPTDGWNESVLHPSSFRFHPSHTSSCGGSGVFGRDGIGVLLFPEPAREKLQTIGRIIRLRLDRLDPLLRQLREAALRILLEHDRIIVPGGAI